MQNENFNDSDLAWNIIMNRVETVVSSAVKNLALLYNALPYFSSFELNKSDESIQRQQVEIKT